MWSRGDLGQPLALLLLGAEQAQRLGQADRLVRGQQRRDRRVPGAGHAPAPCCSRPGVRPSPPYSSGIFIPSAPSSLRPSMTSSGIFASRSICCGSTCSVEEGAQALRGTPRPSRPRRGRAAGCGWIRSRRKLPRKSSLPKDGCFHSVSRLASATCLDCSYDGFEAMAPKVPIRRLRTDGRRARSSTLGLRVDRARRGGSGALSLAIRSSEAESPLEGPGLRGQRAGSGVDGPVSRTTSAREPGQVRKEAALSGPRRA